MRAILASFLFFCAQGYGQTADTLVVLFPYNQSVLSPREAARIDSFGQAHRQVSGISLTGHCDNVGGDRYNDSLSLMRVEAVRHYLLGQAIPDSLVRTAKAYGKRQPLNDNGNEEKRAINRRVEVIWYTKEGAPAPIPAGGAQTEPGDKTLPGDAPPTTPGDSLIEPEPHIPLGDLFKDPAAMVGKSVILRDVNFYGGHHYPDPGSYRVLNDLLALMGRLPGLRIEIQGFVCCLPDSVDALDLDTHIINLSTARARFIYDYLNAHGIDTARMRYKGFQASYKRYPDERSERERSQNRRVQIRVTGWKP